MKFGLKWVHMARYELILRLDGALWLRIILKPLLTQKMAYTNPKVIHKSWLGLCWDNHDFPCGPIGSLCCYLALVGLYELASMDPQ